MTVKREKYKYLKLTYEKGTYKMYPDIKNKVYEQQTFGIHSIAVYIRLISLIGVVILAFFSIYSNSIYSIYSFLRSEIKPITLFFCQKVPVSHLSP